MKMRRVSVLSCVGIVILSLFFVSGNIVSSLPESIFNYFVSYNQRAFEKLYLHLDKPYYAAGENIWFKGYVLNVATHQAETKSNFIYVELIDPSNQIVIRKKYKRLDGLFQGNLPLPVTFPKGEYTIRAYTAWMQNQDSEFFYHRNIKVGNVIDVSVQSSVEYIPDGENRIQAKIKYYNVNGEPLTEVEVECKEVGQTGKIDKTILRKTNEEGVIWLDFPVSEKQKPLYVETKFVESPYEYEQTFHIPRSPVEYSFTFMPEGGNLLEGVNQVVAFKSQGADGHSKDVRGCIRNQHGDSVAAVKTEHNGMGIVYMNPGAGDSFYAELISSEGVSRKVDLPKVQPQGFGLSLSRQKENIRFVVQSTPTTQWPDSLYVLAHSRGKIVLLETLTKQRSQGIVSMDLFPEGIAHFMLFDASGVPVSERLTFIHPKQTHWSVTADKDNYELREKVKLAIALKDEEGIPLYGDFSISVTDSKVVHPDPNADNIVSNLLLTSDLKGFVEDPGFYFRQRDNRTLFALDLIMLTHGWRRFNVKNIREDKLPEPVHFVEKGQYLSGTVRNLARRKSKGANVVAAVPGRNITKIVTTDKNGKFVIDGLDFQDSTRFAIQAKTKRNLSTLELEMDQENIPAIAPKLPFFRESLAISPDYLTNSLEKYYYEGGEKIFRLKEVVITAEKQRENANQSFSANQLQKDKSISVGKIFGDLMRDFHNKRLDIGSDRYCGEFTVVIDGMVYFHNPYDDTRMVLLNSIRPEDVEELLFYEDIRQTRYNLFQVSNCLHPILILILKDSAKMRRSFSLFLSLGYSKPAEFYNPVYDTPEKVTEAKDDLRTTIYWNPAMAIDSTGCATVEFYTTDGSNQYAVEIEGVTADGKVCRYFK